MTIHQLSIFLENKKGTMLHVLNMLKDAGIQVIASTISDTVEYGIYRVICNNPSKAFALLKEQGLSVTLSDVFAIELDKTPGQAAQVFEAFCAGGIKISYMYSFMLAGKGILIFRTSDTDKAREIITLNQMRFISQDSLDDSL